MKTFQLWVGTRNEPFVSYHYHEALRILSNRVHIDSEYLFVLIKEDTSAIR